MGADWVIRLLVACTLTGEPSPEQPTEFLKKATGQVAVWPSFRACNEHANYLRNHNFQDATCILTPRGQEDDR